jgi:hypothetical protein
MAVLAVVIALSFITLWVRDKNRADEVADDPERTDDSTAAPQHGTRPGADGLG